MWKTLDEADIESRTESDHADRVLYTIASSYYHDPTVDLTDVLNNGLQSIMAVSSGNQNYKWQQKNHPRNVQWGNKW